MIRFILNEKDISTDLPSGMVLLDFIRYHQQLTGTKIGCREGDCGACTVLVGEIVNGKLCYESMTSCLIPVGNAHGKHIVTIEGVNFPGRLNPVQQAMADAGATQCGFCTPGFILSLTGFCLSEKETTLQNAIAAVDGNICRCTGYKSIERAAGHIASIMMERNGEEPAVFASRKKILPEYFSLIKARLLELETKKFSPGFPAQPVGGGTDLYVQKHDELANKDLRFLADEPGLKGITREDNTCFLGASVTVSDLQHSLVINTIFPDFQRYAKLVSSTPIRNMATLAGNIINASPIGDLTIFFLALDAQVDLSGQGDRRTLPLRKLYKGYKQLNKDPAEIIQRIWFEVPEKNSYFHFEKVSKRTHLDIASVNSAIRITLEGERIGQAGLSAGGVGPVPLFLRQTSEYLKGNKITEEVILESIDVMKKEISPISDARGSKEYKTLLLGQLIKAHFMTLFPELSAEKLMK